VSLRPPEKVEKLQTTLHAKAKESPDYRFYALYDKVYRADVLSFAFDKCRANGGAPGVDGQTFEDIEAYGVEKWLGELTEELRAKRYVPQPVRRRPTLRVCARIPKPGQPDKTRPLGIPTIRDRRPTFGVCPDDGCTAGLGADLRGPGTDRRLVGSRSNTPIVPARARWTRFTMSARS
jgi:hypothetical protein